MARMSATLALLLLGSAVALQLEPGTVDPAEAQMCSDLMELARKMDGAPQEVVEGPATPLDHHKNNVQYVYPEERPGCFMRMPTGCPNHYKKTHAWRHDVVAEMNISESTCKSRKPYWDSYCGTKDVKVIYVSEPGKELAKSRKSGGDDRRKYMVFDKYPGVESRAPGCFVRMPTGCPNHFHKTRLWRHDVMMEELSSSGADCKKRKKYWDEYCGTNDVKVVFVPDGNSTKQKN